jgi:hypothetical protein
VRVVQSGIEVKPQDIQLPPHALEGLSESLIESLKASQEHGAALQPVIISSAGNVLCDGRHRYAAALRAGLPVRADIVEFDDPEEMELTEIATTLDRKDLDQRKKDKLRERRVHLWEVRLGRAAGITHETTSSVSRQKKRGPGKSTRSKAVELAAAQENVTPRAIEQSLERAAEPDPVESDPKVMATKEEVETLGKLAEPQLRLGDVAKTISKAIERAEKVNPALDRMPGKFDQKLKDARLSAVGAVGAALQHLKKALAYVQDAEKVASELRGKIDKQLYPPAKISAQELLVMSKAADAAEASKTSKGRHQQRQKEAQEKRDVHNTAKRAEKAEAPPPEPEQPDAETGAPCGSCGEHTVSVDEGYCLSCGTPVEQPDQPAEMPMGLSEPPKVGLQAPKRKLKVKTVDNEGNEAEYTHALAEADSAGVAGGPPEDGDIPW